MPGPYPRHVGRHGTTCYRTGGPLAPAGPASPYLSDAAPSLPHAPSISPSSTLSLRPSLHSLPAQQRRPSPSLPTAAPLARPLQRCSAVELTWPPVAELARPLQLRSREEETGSGAPLQR